MSNYGSLLAYLSSRFRGNTEDIAVEALGYILSTSEASRAGLLGLLRSGGAKGEELSRVATQVGGDDGERPDLVGWDSGGDERLLVEAKFWAGLTPNQPNAYLKRLPTGGTLLFVAPEARLDALWPELERRAKQEFEWTADAGDARTAAVDGKRLILTSWRTLLEAAEHRASAAGDIAAVTSIRELNGLCERQDEAAFVPLRPGEFGPDLPRRLMNLHTIINKAVDRAEAKGLLKWAGTAAPATDGYGRSLELGVQDDGTWVNGKLVGVRLCVHYTAWSLYRETPVWLQLHEWKGTLPLKKVRKRLRDEIVVGRDGTDFVPFHLPTGVELDHVVDSIVARLRDLAHRIAGLTAD
ncbi:MAG: hypothetical protein F4210_14520 [Holophagales bacterium]|nr:hypothetical protein [Holophagales bacterium]MYF96695.1 hypothetical protein [Holophagales bacterium]